MDAPRKHYRAERGAAGERSFSSPGKNKRPCEKQTKTAVTSYIIIKNEKTARFIIKPKSDFQESQKPKEKVVINLYF